LQQKSAKFRQATGLGGLKNSADAGQMQHQQSASGGLAGKSKQHGS